MTGSSRNSANQSISQSANRSKNRLIGNSALEGTEQSSEGALKWRFRVVRTLFLFGFFCLVARMALLQVVPDAEQGFSFLQDQGESRSIRAKAIPAYRGTIFDRHGEPLAISTPLRSIWVNPSEFDFSKLADLSNALDVPVSDMAAKIERASGKQFIYLKRGVPPQMAESVMVLDIAGVNAETEFRRFYPEGEVTAQLLGLTNVDDRGIEGIELGYDNIFNTAIINIS